MSSSAALTLDEAHQLLKQFSCLQSPSLQPPDRQADEARLGDRPHLKQALMLLTAESDYQMLGICADSIEAGRTALAAYTKALGYQPSLELQPIEGPVYIKFNSRTMSCYASPYEGEHRGVLVSCQSADEDGINEMYGHLPIDLFVD
jgi:hypothetical protein